MFKRWLKNKLRNFLIHELENMGENNQSTLFLKYKKSAQDSIYKGFRKKYSIDKTFRFNGEGIMLYGNGGISCGENSYIGNYSTLQSDDSCKIVIGNNCSISHNVRIYTTTNIVDQDFSKVGEKKKKHASVIISNGAWIGANVFINPGITIGENAIVGANSVVTKDIEANAIYGGVPAKLIRYKKIPGA